jgi:hypothetical protein
MTHGDRDRLAALKKAEKKLIIQKQAADELDHRTACEISRKFELYEMNTDGTGLEQVTARRPIRTRILLDECIPRKHLRSRYLKVGADLAREEVVHLAVPGNRRRLAG